MTAPDAGGSEVADRFPGEQGWLVAVVGPTPNVGTVGGELGPRPEGASPPEFWPKATMSATPIAIAVSNGTTTTRSAFVESEMGTLRNDRLPREAWRLGGQLAFSSWPPKPFRIADSTLFAKLSRPLEAKRE